MNSASTAGFIERLWNDDIVPALRDYIEIPNQSPQFDADWELHGHMQRAVDLVAAWCRERLPAGARLEVVRLPGRTPVLLMEVEGASDRPVLLYGHLDKQPPMTGWAEGLGPWTPVLRGDRLYGRGGADDGYAAFASVTALAALAADGRPHARCVVLIEACEESGSTDLPAYIEALGGRIGRPDLVVCLDSGCGNYEQLWCTTSLRGMAAGTLQVDVMTEGVHSGDASGIVPGAFRIARELLARIEDGASGRILLPELHAVIPDERVAQAAAAAQALGGDVGGKFPLLDGVRPVTEDATELVLNRTWRPALAVTGCTGLPPIESAGNVMLPGLHWQLSMRLPPTCDAGAALKALRTALTAKPPYGAHVRFVPETPCDGWNAPPLAPWLGAAMGRASHAHFGRPACLMGEGGSIPFMGMLGRRFPQAQFLITGVLGPQSNAHGPNEFLHLPTAKRLTACVADVLAEHHLVHREPGAHLAR
jgi:acetylornithine deacetylase/succinyl-diaminopimelate desuccinylase-like protein